MERHLRAAAHPNATTPDTHMQHIDHVHILTAHTARCTSAPPPLALHPPPPRAYAKATQKKVTRHGDTARWHGMVTAAVARPNIRAPPRPTAYASAVQVLILITQPVGSVHCGESKEWPGPSAALQVQPSFSRFPAQAQILRKESHEPVQSAIPSIETPKQLTRLSWPARTPTCLPVRVSHT